MILNIDVKWFEYNKHSFSFVMLRTRFRYIDVIGLTAMYFPVYYVYIIRVCTSGFESGMILVYTGYGSHPRCSDMNFITFS
jgi:hypothetical protein